MFSISRSAVRTCVRLTQTPAHRCGGSIAVYLLDDVENRGSKGEVVKVKRGHARNLLIPKKRAVYATEANLMKHGYVNKAAAKASNEKAAKEIEAKLAAFLADPLVFSRAATPSGSLFGSVSVNDVKDYVGRQLKDFGAEVIVEIPQAIKTAGEHSIRVNNQPAIVLVNSL